MAVPAIAKDFKTYRDALLKFSRLSNPSMPVTACDRLAATYWGVARGNWKVAVRLAAKSAAESHFRILVWMPEGTPQEGQPRTDPLGCHYNFLAFEACRVGLMHSWKDWKRSDEWDHLKALMIQDPTLGAWLGARGYVRLLALNHGDMAKTEKMWAEDPNYLKTVLAKERLFGRMIGVVPGDVARDQIFVGGKDEKSPVDADGHGSDVRGRFQGVLQFLYRFGR